MGKVGGGGNVPKFKKNRGANYRLRKEAERLTRDAIKKGKLIPQPCEVCGSTGTAHHDDYAKPLEVRWLCHRHHITHHLRGDKYWQLKLL